MDLTLFQSPEWENFKLKTGYQKSHRVDGILVLQKSLPLGRTMLYSPMISQNQESRIKNQEFIDEIEKIGREDNSIFYRMELNFPIIHDSSPIIHKRFIKAFEEMQPENNWVLDITKPEEEILTGMKQKGRYNIKIAEKSGLSFTSSKEKDSKELNAFYSQYAETGKRHKISFRAKSYFEKLLEILQEKDYASVYTVWHENIPLASAVIVFYGGAAIYLYGGSSDSHRELMAPYLLHWNIIKEAKERNLNEYNFLGIAPDDDGNHPWSGITRFKKQFGGYQADVVGSYDLPLKPMEYKAFKIAEKLRRH